MLRRAVIGLTGLLFLLLATDGVASAQAATQTFVNRSSFDEIGQFVCVDEPVHLTGDFQTVTHVTEDGAGGYTVIINSNYAGFTGVGVNTGQRYRSVGSAVGHTAEHHAEFGSFPATINYVAPAHLIAQGQPNPGVEFTFKFQSHFTINANGEVVVDRPDLVEECR